MGKPWPGQEVISLQGQQPVRSHILSPLALPRSTRQFSTVIQDVATTGNSGSGLFDANRKCLLGIMSRKISQIGIQNGQRVTQDIAKYFVPASIIDGFIPPRLRLRGESISPLPISRQ